ncbi:MAG: hypothetical protein JRI85_16780, partial [Deltaproteobacteria bacterium]|nr:hypothetical protein [Deltaproteobacteria bacterium]
MQSRKKGKDKKTEDNSLEDNPLIGIIGQQELLKELLTWFFKRETGLDCACSLNTDQTPLDFNQDITKMRLVLLDCESINSTTLRNKLDAVSKKIPRECMIALFNVNHGQGIEKEAAYQGVRGVFYQDDPLGAIQKGVPSILKGDLWFSRETLFKGLQESKP